MGGNALSEPLVFGARAGSAAAAWANRSGGEDRQAFVKDLRERARKWSSGTPIGGELKERLRKIMWEDGGIIRGKKGLSRALSAVKGIQNEASVSSSKFKLNGKELLDLIEIRSAAEVATLILEAALLRRESRGGHFREDFPDQNDTRCGNDIFRSILPQTGRMSGSLNPKQEAMGPSMLGQPSSHGR
jgi:succinate dehydrogenase/fumarate reductase flavoprotein subunit